MALIFYMSSFPAPEPVKAVPIFFDIKIVHIVEYGFLSFLVYYALDNTTSLSLFWKMIFSVEITILYGLTDELHQIFVPGRSGRLVDIFANFIGCVIFQSFILFVKKRNV